MKRLTIMLIGGVYLILGGCTAAQRQYSIKFADGSTELVVHNGTGILDELRDPKGNLALIRIGNTHLSRADVLTLAITASHKFGSAVTYDLRARFLKLSEEMPCGKPPAWVPDSTRRDRNRNPFSISGNRVCERVVSGKDGTGFEQWRRTDIPYDYEEVVGV